MDRYLCEFRTAQGAAGVTGHASVFGQVAQIRNGFERIDPRAFDRALREEHDVVLLVNHEGLPLASTRSGSLRLGVDDVGLTVDADLPNTTLGGDVRELMSRGLLDRMSFGFIPTADSYDTVEGRQVRTITDLDLFDVSLVSLPAYAGTDAALRRLDLTPAAPGLPVRIIRARARLLLGETE